jgi:hypothetical protein
MECLGGREAARQPRIELFGQTDRHGILGRPLTADDGARAAEG